MSREVGDPTGVTLRKVTIIGHGWHSTLAFRCEDVIGLFPEPFTDQPEEYLEFGWGDCGFFNASRITIGIVLRALLLPTPSTMHVGWMNGPLWDYFPHSDIVEVLLPQDRFAKICHWLAGNLKVDEQNQPNLQGKGLYGKSAFFGCKGSYYFPKTCNVWIALALRAGGFSMFPWIRQTAGSLLRRIGKFGTIIAKGVDWKTMKEAMVGGQPNPTPPFLPEGFPPPPPSLPDPASPGAKEARNELCD